MQTSRSFTGKYLFHILLWAVVTISMAVDAYHLYRLNAATFFFFVFGKTLVQAGLVYINLLLFFPALYKKKKYAGYTLSLLLITLVAGYANMKLELYVCPNCNFQNSNQHLFFFLSQLMMAARYTLLSFLLKITVDFYEQKENMRRMEAEKARAELNFLKVQVNPHFLFNTLNSLYALILEKSDKSAECVLKLADMMKYILAEGKEEKVSLQKEAGLLRNYIELERLRKPDAAISLVMSGETERLYITPLLLLPLVENAFKYGLNTVAKNGFVNISIVAQNGGFLLTVENNVPPGDNRDAVKGLGIGIENVRQRLQLLYPGRYRLQTGQGQGVYSVSLQLQLLP